MPTVLTTGSALKLPPPQQMLTVAVQEHLAGRLDVALRKLDELLAIYPDCAEAYTNRGAALQALGDQDSAIACYHKALSLRPDYPDALNNLGMALQFRGRADEALPLFQKSLELAPGRTDTLNNLGTAHRALGRNETAINYHRQALGIDGRCIDAWVGLGAALQDGGDLEKAKDCYHRAIELQPDRIDALNNLAVVLQIEGQIEEAVALLQKIVSMDPRNADALNNLGVMLRELNRDEEALTCYRLAILAKPAFAKALTNLGALYQERGQVAEAVGCFEQAVAAGGDIARTQYYVGQMFAALGQMDDARCAYKKAIDLAPTRIEPYLGLIEVSRLAPDDPYFRRLEQLANHIDQLTLREQIDLHFALGKTLDGQRDLHRAMEHFLKGNALKRRLSPYNERHTMAMFDRIRALCTADWLASQSGHGDDSEVPIFILGMPRSGTTLIEQILASHPRVFGAGECETFRRLISSLQTRDGRPLLAPETTTREVRPEDWHAIASAYVSELRARAPKAPHITDKMPGNFLYVGLIHCALPGARIIHVRRNALDTCLSCFTQQFAGHHPYTYDLAGLGRYWLAYDRLMAHWRTVLPAGTLLEVQYEDVIADQEQQTRRMLDYCGLEWDPACLQFHNTQRTVRTASVAQVRQSIYKTSVGRAAGYGDALKPLIDTLQG